LALSPALDAQRISSRRPDVVGNVSEAGGHLARI
jgi:hypothetical protein